MEKMEWNNTLLVGLCQEIGLVASMFFFELLFSYVSSQFPSMFPLLTYSQSFFFLICWSPETLKTKEKQDFNSTNTGNSLKVILRLRNLSRFPNWLVDPLVDLYQSLHSNSASTTSILSGPLYPKLSTCFEGAQLTQLVQLVTAGRLFPCHKGQVDP